jgi:hypothetical protein
MIMEMRFGNIEKADFIRIFSVFIFVTNKLPKTLVFSNNN